MRSSVLWYRLGFGLLAVAAATLVLCAVVSMAPSAVAADGSNTEPNSAAANAADGEWEITAESEAAV
ncbi:MAG: hypothetical protein ACKO6B_05320, partial [Planctomycetia bacterium]